MATQSEAALENGLIKTLIDNSYERVLIKRLSHRSGEHNLPTKSSRKFSSTSKAGHGLKRLKNCAISIRWKPKTGNAAGSNFSTNANGVRTNFRYPTR